MNVQKVFYVTLALLCLSLAVIFMTESNDMKKEEEAIKFTFFRLDSCFVMCEESNRFSLGVVPWDLRSDWVLISVEYGDTAEVGFRNEYNGSSAKVLVVPKYDKLLFQDPELSAVSEFYSFSLVGNDDVEGSYLVGNKEGWIAKRVTDQNTLELFYRGVLSVATFRVVDRSLVIETCDHVERRIDW